MIAKITKISGGRLPDGFWVIGKMDVPMETFNVMATEIKEVSEMSCLHTKDWFITENIKDVFKTEWGYLFIAGKSLWKFVAMFKDADGKWKID